MNQRNTTHADTTMTITEADLRYRNCTIMYNPKPIPTTTVDWDWVHDHFDGAPDSETRNLCGNAASAEACKQEIDEVIDDYEWDGGPYCQRCGATDEAEFSHGNEETCDSCLRDRANRYE